MEITKNCLHNYELYFINNNENNINKSIFFIFNNFFNNNVNHLTLTGKKYGCSIASFGVILYA